MNGSYYQNPIFPGQGLMNNTIPNQQSIPSLEQNQSIDEQSYIENILRLNRGKRAEFHITVPGSKEWQDKVFKGIIEQSGKDHIIVSNPENGSWYLILMIYLNFVTFDEAINYSSSFVLPNN